MGRMCADSMASEGSIARQLSRIHASFSVGSSSRSHDSCCMSDSKTPCDSGAGDCPKIASRAGSTLPHTHVTISTEDNPNAFVNASSSCPSSTNLPSSIVGSMDDSRSASDVGCADAGGAEDAPAAAGTSVSKISAADRTSFDAARRELTSGPTSAAIAFSFCVYSSVAMSSIPRSNVDRTCSNISPHARSNLGTTTFSIACCNAGATASLIAFASLAPFPPPCFVFAAISDATAGANDLSSLRRSFSICTGRSRVIAAETAMRSSF
mmetsp:Transcript_6166/g.22583  ORF Transcript_6166/g.22583 Transcript_6166/m.22583 type:complete len:267 (+) Transcript_6166:269-1069(+)